MFFRFLICKIKIHFDNGLCKVSPYIHYLFGNYLSSLPINKKCISFYLFCLTLNCMAELLLCHMFFLQCNVLLVMYSIVYYISKQQMFFEVNLNPSFKCSLINFKKYWFSTFSGQYSIKSIPFKSTSENTIPKR